MKWAARGETVAHATQNDVQLKVYELFISGIFHLVFSDYRFPRVTETVESKIEDGGPTELYDSVYLKFKNRRKQLTGVKVRTEGTQGGLDRGKGLRQPSWVLGMP